VLLPLVLVFMWPALSMFFTTGPVETWTVEEPILAGYALVALMGAGNYLGSRFTISACLWLVALTFLVGPLCPATATYLPNPPVGRGIVAIFLTAAGWLAVRLARSIHNTGRPELPLETLWRDFRDAFGIVWARRVEERFNEGADKQGLSIRLEMHGLRNTAGCADAADLPASDLTAAETLLRWLLVKFVEPGWIDERLRGRGSGPFSGVPR
jgi:hypothetical protein